MNEQLIVALNVLLEIKDAQGLNAKRDLLIENKSNNTLQDILYFVFNPYIRTGIGWSKLNKMEGPIEIPNDVAITSSSERAFVVFCAIKSSPI